MHHIDYLKATGKSQPTLTWGRKLGKVWQTNTFSQNVRSNYHLIPLQPYISKDLTKNINRANVKSQDIAWQRQDHKIRRKIGTYCQGTSAIQNRHCCTQWNQIHRWGLFEGKIPILLEEAVFSWNKWMCYKIAHPPCKSRHFTTISVYAYTLMFRWY